MPILAAFIIGICILTGFQPVISQPDNEILIDIGNPGTNSAAAGTNVGDGAGTSVYSSQQVSSLDELQFSNISKQSYDFSCGSAALATLLNGYLGENLSERQVIEGLMEYGSKKKIALHGFYT